MVAYLGGPIRVEYELKCDRLTRAVNRAVLELTIEGRPTVMLVPLVLVSGVEVEAPAPLG